MNDKQEFRPTAEQIARVTDQIKGTNTTVLTAEQQQPQEVKELVSALKLALAALRDVVRQLPNDQSLADYRLDFAETAEAKAIELLAKYPLP